MSEAIIRDNYFLLYSLLMGIAVTVLYDVLRILRCVIPHNNLCVSIEDLLYWIVVAVCVFLMMQRENDGVLRWFAILGALAGMGCYKALLSPHLVKGVAWLLEKLLIPFRFLGKKLSKGCSWTGRKSARGLHFLKKKLTRGLKTFKIILCKR